MSDDTAYEADDDESTSTSESTAEDTEGYDDSEEEESVAADDTEAGSDDAPEHWNQVLGRLSQEVGPLRQENKALQEKLDRIVANTTQPQVEEKEPEIDYSATLFSDANATLGQYEKRILDKVKGLMDTQYAEKVQPVLEPMENSLKANEISQSNKLFQKVVSNPAMRSEIEAIRNDPSMADAYHDAKTNFLKAVAFDAYAKLSEKDQAAKGSRGPKKARGMGGAQSPAKGSNASPKSPGSDTDKVLKMEDKEFGRYLQKLYHEMDD